MLAVTHYLNAQTKEHVVILQMNYVLEMKQDAAIMENDASIINAALQLKPVEVSVVVLVKLAILLHMSACLFNVQVHRHNANHWMEVTQYVANQG